MSNADAIALLKSKLHASLDSQNLSLYAGSNTPVNFNFGTCVDALAAVLWNFYTTRGRMPTVIFNDGVPLSAAAILKADPKFNQAFAFDAFTVYETTVNGDIPFNSAVPVFNVKVKLNGKPWNGYQELQLINGDFEIASKTLPLEPVWINSRRFGNNSNIPLQTLPLDLVEYGTYQTWGILLVLYSRPDLCFASDDGIMLHPAGVAMLEKSLAYYVERRTNNGYTLQKVSVDQIEGAGPVTIGVPQTVVDKFYDLWIQSRSGGTGKFFLYILQIVLTFVGFYFGASALSGTLAGNFTIANLSGSLSMAQRFGVDIGDVGLALKAISLTAGDDVFNNLVNTGGSAVDDFWSGDIVLPTDYDNLWVDMDGIFDDLGLETVSFDMVDYPDLADWNVDIGFDQSTYLESLDVFNAAPAYDDVAILAENDLALAQAMGPVSEAQYVASAGAAPSVASAASASMQTVGSTSAVTASPQQIGTAATNAARAAQNLKNLGNASESTIWATASKLLTLYGQYQQTALRTALPSRVQYPSGVGKPVRQPDGSVSIMNADGTVSTVRPNGSVLTNGAGSALPSFLQGNTGLLIAAGGLGLIALIAFTRNRR